MRLRDIKTVFGQQLRKFQYFFCLKHMLYHFPPQQCYLLQFLSDFSIKRSLQVALDKQWGHMWPTGCQCVIQDCWLLEKKKNYVLPVLPMCCWYAATSRTRQKRRKIAEGGADIQQVERPRRAFECGLPDLWPVPVVVDFCNIGFDDEDCSTCR